MTDWVWLNGAFLRRDAAFVSVDDRSFLMGDGIFETLRAYRGRVFKLAEHLERLQAGLDETRIALPFALAALGAAAEELLVRNQCPEARVRLTVSRGVPQGHQALADFSRPYQANVLITATAVHSARETFERGWSLRTFPSAGGGSPYPHVKFTSYGPHVLVRARAIAAGCDEALLLNAQGRACEGAMSNLFWVERGELLTPPLSEGCLAGVTRQTLLELARKHGVPCAEQPAPLERLLAAAELFMSASVLELAPVRELDGNKIGAAAPGPLTRNLRALYDRAIAEFLNSD